MQPTLLPYSPLSSVGAHFDSTIVGERKASQNVDFQRSIAVCLASSDVVLVPRQTGIVCKRWNHQTDLVEDVTCALTYSSAAYDAVFDRILALTEQGSLLSFSKLVMKAGEQPAFVDFIRTSAEQLGSQHLGQLIVHRTSLLVSCLDVTNESDAAPVTPNPDAPVFLERFSAIEQENFPAPGLGGFGNFGFGNTAPITDTLQFKVTSPITLHGIGIYVPGNSQGKTQVIKATLALSSQQQVLLAQGTYREAGIQDCMSNLTQLRFNSPVRLDAGPDYLLQVTFETPSLMYRCLAVKKECKFNACVVQFHERSEQLFGGPQLLASRLKIDFEMVCKMRIHFDFLQTFQLCWLRMCLSSRKGHRSLQLCRFPQSLHGICALLAHLEVSCQRFNGRGLRRSKH